MKWIRSGDWRLDNAGRVAELHPLPPPNHRSATGDVFPDAMPHWVREIGEPSGLEVYEVTPRGIPAMLNDFARFAEEFGDHWANNDEVTGATAGALLRLLKEYGPLAPVAGVVTPGRVRSAPLLSDRQVPLWFVHQDIDQLVNGWAGVREAEIGLVNREQVARWIARASEDVLRHETQAHPDFRNDGIEFDVRPVSLRAQLWLFLINRLGRPTRRLCQYCGEPFELPRGQRGRLPEYCPEHRSSKYRKRVNEGVAPYQQLHVRVEFDDSEAQGAEQRDDSEARRG